MAKIKYEATIKITLEAEGDPAKMFTIDEVNQQVLEDLADKCTTMAILDSSITVQEDL